jgi:flagellar hook assembly protein FlgD
MKQNEKIMKTKNVVLAIVAVCMSGLVLANGPVSSKVVVINQKAGLFKVIYEGATAGRVSMRITNQNGQEVYAETVQAKNGFIVPVNFTGMEKGAYTVEISDKNGRVSQTVNYSEEKEELKNAHVTKIAEAGKYLVAVGNRGEGQITVRIYDENSNLVHDQDLKITGNYGVVYNLQNVTGAPRFEITDEKGKSLVSK